MFLPKRLIGRIFAGQLDQAVAAYCLIMYVIVLPQPLPQPATSFFVFWLFVVNYGGELPHCGASQPDSGVFCG